MRSLRWRLTIALFVLLTTVGVAAAAAAYFVVQGEPDELLDDQLRQIAVTVGDEARPLPPMDPPIEREDEILVVIRDSTGAMVRHSDPTVSLPPARETGFSDVVVHHVGWRVYALKTQDWAIQIAQRQETRDELAAEIAFQAVAPIAILIPLSWLLLGVVITRLFRPLDRLTDELREAPADRIRPLATAGLPSEVVPLVEEVNALLARQNELLEMRKRFISDAAHQLRTPLTALQLQVGNLARAEGSGALAADIAEVRRGIARMSRLASQLLDLARAEDPAADDAAPSVELAPIMRRTIETILPLAQQRSIDLGVTAEAPARVGCREQDVAAVTANVIDNAVRYTPAGGRVDVSSETADGLVRVVVRDTGPGVAASELERLFERFVRAARSPSGGAGLGLAIVRAAAERSGMTVRLENAEPPPGLVATIEMPLASV